MLHILFIILKIIGILLLAVLGLVLAVLLLVLFAPFRYYVDGAKQEEICFHAKVTWVLFVLRVACSYEKKKLIYYVKLFGYPIVTNEEKKAKKKKSKKKKEKPLSKEEQELLEELELEARREETEQETKKEKKPKGKKQGKEKKKTDDKKEQSKKQQKEQEEKKASKEAKKEKAKEAVQEEHQEPLAEQKDEIEQIEKTKETKREETKKEDSKWEEQDKKEKDTKRKVEQEQKIKEDDKRKSGQVQKQKKPKKALAGALRNAFEKIRYILYKGKYTIKTVLSSIRHAVYKVEAIIGKIGSLMETIGQWISFLCEEMTKAALAKVMKLVKKLLHHILPRKLSGNLTIGFEDPAMMGRVLAILGMAMPIYKDSLNVTPCFDETIVQGDVKAKGRIRLAYIVYLALVALIDKNIRETIKKAKALAKGDEESEGGDEQ